MEPNDKSISAAILTAAYLQGSNLDPDQYVSVYVDFLRKIEGLSSETQRQSDESNRRRPRSSYHYTKST